MDHQHVFAVISDERAYQEKMTSKQERPDMVEDFTLAHGLSTIEYHLDLARNAWYSRSEEDGYKEAMNYIRKIAGVCVKLGERYGMPERE